MSKKTRTITYSFVLLGFGIVLVGAFFFLFPENGFYSVDFSKDRVLVGRADLPDPGPPFTEEWDPVKGRRVVEANADVFRAYEKCLKAKTFRRPNSVDFDEYLWEHLGTWGRIQSIVCDKIALLKHEGKYREALGEALGLARFGYLIENSNGGVITFHAGVGRKTMGLFCINHLLSKITESPEWLLGIVQELELLQTDASAVKDCVKVEQEAISRWIDDFVAGKVSHYDGRDVSKYRSMIDPDKVESLVAETVSQVLDNLDRAPNDRKRLKDRSDYPLGQKKNLADYDLHGYDLWVTFSDVAGGYDRSRLWLVGSQVLCALRAFQIRNGDLPMSLDRLVPHYMESVPVDPFDGKPLRYSKEKRHLWSVGRDLIDSGGGGDPVDDEIIDGWLDFASDRDEPVLRIPF